MTRRTNKRPKSNVTHRNRANPVLNFNRLDPKGKDVRLRDKIARRQSFTRDERRWDWLTRNRGIVIIIGGKSKQR